jgi:hypothetical protein
VQFNENNNLFFISLLFLFGPIHRFEFLLLLFGSRVLSSKKNGKGSFDFSFVVLILQYLNEPNLFFLNSI